MLEIQSRPIGDGQPAFIIAEAGVNHNGDVELGFRLIDVAKEAGADAVKFQTFKSEEIAAAEAPMAEYQKENLAIEESQQAMLKKLELKAEDYHRLLQHCNEVGITFISTPFDRSSVDLLVAMDVPAIKVSSGDLTDLPLLEHLGRQNKPVILSTGMGNLSEIEEALAALATRDLALLHCVSDYPAPLETINLRAIETMRSAFALPIGYSDHTLGSEASLGAIAMGACIIEKHLTLDSKDEGPDHAASMEPDAFRDFVTAIRNLEVCLGDGVKRPRGNEPETAKVVRKSLAAARDLAPGEPLTEISLTSKRPGTGIPPRERPQLIGRRVRRAIEAGTLLDHSDFE